MVKLTPVSCNHCGAPLDVPAKVRFVTCTYCESRLEIHREGSAAFSEVLEAVEANTREIADDVEVIRLNSEIEQLDREWTLEREKYMITGKHGHQHLPSKQGGFVGGIVVIGFGVLWTIVAFVIASSMARSGFGSGPGKAAFLFPCCGVLFVIFGFFAILNNSKKADEYQKAQQAYQARRQALMEKMRRRD